MSSHIHAYIDSMLTFKDQYLQSSGIDSDATCLYLWVQAEVLKLIYCCVWADLIYIPIQLHSAPI